MEHLQEIWGGGIIEATLSSLETHSGNPTDFLMAGFRHFGGSLSKDFHGT